MRNDDLFKDLDDMDIYRIAQEFPVLTNDEKERIYAMSEIKYEKENSTDKDCSDIDEIVVSGVEHYKRPSWYKYVSAAAAVVLVIGGISGSMLLMKHVKTIHQDNIDLSTAATGEKTTLQTYCDVVYEVFTEPATEVSAVISESATETTEITTVETTSEAQTEPEEEYEAVALELTDKFADLVNKLNRNVQYDPYDSIDFRITKSDDYLNERSRTYYSRITEPGFDSSSYFTDAFKEICTEELFERFYNNAGFEEKSDPSDHEINIELSKAFKADLSRYYTDDHLELYMDYGFNTADFIIYRGGLYVCTDSLPSDWKTYSDQPSVLDKAEGSFRSVRNALFSPVCNDSASQKGEPLTFTFVKEGDSWKISSIAKGQN